MVGPKALMHLYQRISPSDSHKYKKNQRNALKQRECFSIDKKKDSRSQGGYYLLFDIATFRQSLISSGETSYLGDILWKPSSLWNSCGERSLVYIVFDRIVCRER